MRRSQRPLLEDAPAGWLQVSGRIPDKEQICRTLWRFAIVSLVSSEADLARLSIVADKGAAGEEVTRQGHDHQCLLAPAIAGDNDLARVCRLIWGKLVTAAEVRRTNEQAVHGQAGHGQGPLQAQWAYGSFYSPANREGCRRGRPCSTLACSDDGSRRGSRCGLLLN